jgi:hypothetical protein
VKERGEHRLHIFCVDVLVTEHPSKRVIILKIVPRSSLRGFIVLVSERGEIIYTVDGIWEGLYLTVKFFTSSTSCGNLIASNRAAFFSVVDFTEIFFSIFFSFFFPPLILISETVTVLCWL